MDASQCKIRSLWGRTGKQASSSGSSKINLLSSFHRLAHMHMHMHMQFWSSHMTADNWDGICLGRLRTPEESDAMLMYVRGWDDDEAAIEVGGCCDGCAHDQGE